METWWRELGDLDEDQRTVIGLPAEGSFLVKGLPGSGKTNLLLLRANYLMNTEHSNLVIIVFNRTLRDFIRSGSER
jgi:superfamily I DNA and RNA helicase